MKEKEIGLTCSTRLYQSLVEQFKREYLLGDPSNRCEDNIRMDLQLSGR